MPQLADIIAEIDRDVEQYGVSRLNTPGKKKAAIGEALINWCDRTLCLFHPSLSLTLNGTQPPYARTNTALYSVSPIGPVSILRIEALTIRGTSIPRMGIHELEAIDPEARSNTESALVPLGWYQLGADYWATYPNIQPEPGNPSAVVGTLAAFFHHPEIDASSPDNTSILLPIECLSDFRLYAMESWIRGQAQGDVALEYARLKAENVLRMDAWRKSNLSKTLPLESPLGSSAPQERLFRLGASL